MSATKLQAAFQNLAQLSPGGPDQVAFVVGDLEESAKHWRSLGFEDWLVYTYSDSTVPELRYRGAATSFGFRLAISGSAPQMELIQPLYGQSIYSEWLERSGFGLHHLGFFVQDLDAACKPFLSAGFEVVQSGAGYGLDGDGAFAYFDLMGTEFRAVLELIEAPSRRRPSEPLFVDQ